MIKLDIINLTVHYPLKSINQYLFRLKIITKFKNFFYKNKNISQYETKKKIVALGGISKQNLKVLKLLNRPEFAGISFFE